jgi:hypothetical protein
MNIPNFFTYDIQVNKEKIGDIQAPCKWVAKKVWNSFNLHYLFPNAKIIFRGLNKKLFSKTS